jgi:hypothetical protein
MKPLLFRIEGARGKELRTASEFDEALRLAKAYGGKRVVRISDGALLATFTQATSFVQNASSEVYVPRRRGRPRKQNVDAAE